MIQIKNAKDAALAIFGAVLIGGIAIPGIVQEAQASNLVGIAMSGKQIGTYNCSNRTFNPSKNTKVGQAATKEWLTDREFSVAIGGGDWMGNLLSDGIFNRFDEICNAR